MSITSSPRIIIIASILIVIAAIAVNANWAGSFGFGLFATNGTDLSENTNSSSVHAMGVCSPVTFANTNTITIPATGTGATTGAPANPYPSNIVVSGLTGNVSKVTVKLKSLTHTFPGDVDVLLVGPGGQNAVIMSDVGGGTDLSGITLTLDDSAAASMTTAALVTGTFKPTNLGSGDPFAAPAPTPVSGSSAMSTFVGTSPNGTWALYVVDDASSDTGSFAGGWEIIITPISCGPTPTASPSPTNTATPTATSTGTPIPQVQVSLAVRSATPGIVVIPIAVGDTTGRGIISYDFQVSFDPTVIQPVPVPISTPPGVSGPLDINGTLSRTMSVTPNISNPGHMIVSAFQGSPISGSGTLIKLRFNVVGTTGQSTAVTFADYKDPHGGGHPAFMFNEGNPVPVLTNGSVTISSCGSSALSNAYTDTALVEAYPGALGNKTPVILIHGNNGNRWPDWMRPGHCSQNMYDCASDPYLHYFHDLILNLNDSGNSYNSNFKTYKFHYVSGLHTTQEIGKALRDKIDERSEFAGKSVILVAHSMGGLVARQYMLQPSYTGTVCQASGARVQKLITLGTPHHGSYGANKESRVLRFFTHNPDQQASYSDIKSIYDGADEIAWSPSRTGCDECSSNPQHPNRGSLLWSNAEGLVPQLASFPNEFPNDLPNTEIYNDKIIAYSGVINPNDYEWQRIRRSLAELALDKVEVFGTNYGGDFSDERSLAVAAFLIDSIYFAGFNLTNVPAPRNDGLVPIESARFDGATLMRRFHCPGYNHLRMEIGYHKPCYDEGNNSVGKLFESVRNQITGGTVLSPPHLSGPDRAGFGYSSHSSWRPYGGELTNTIDIELSNLGDASLQVTSLSIAGENPDQFAIVNIPALPLTIGATSSTHIKVAFNPTSQGPKSAELRASNSSSNSVVIVNIKATGLPEECDLNFSPASQFVSTSGGSGEVMVGNISCPWTVSAVDDWIHPTALADRVSFTVDPNPSTEVRYGTMIISVYGRPYLFSISQDAAKAPCWLQISSDQSVVQAQAGSGSFYITSPPTCSWNIQSDSPWLVPSVGTLEGSGAVGFSADANSGADRSGIITINGSAMTAQFTVHQRGASITGTVTYGNAAAPPKYISNVTVTGTGSQNVSTVTDPPGATAGQYQLTGFGTGSYTVSLSKTTGQNGINSFDAARIAQHVTGISLLANDNQRVSADVTGNGNITSQDAAKIAQVVTGLPFSPPNLTNTWRFFTTPGPTFPVGASPTSRTYPSIASNITGDDYIGLLIGDVTGNWNPTAARPGPNAECGVRNAECKDIGPERGISVTLPEVSAGTDKEIVIPVKVEGIADKNVISYEFDLRYDPSVMQPVGDGVDVKGTISRGLSVVTNPTVPGLLRVVVYGAHPIDENGVLLNLRFAAVGSAGAISPISFERIMFNEGESVTVTTGSVGLSARD